MTNLDFLPRHVAVNYLKKRHHLDIIFNCLVTILFIVLLFLYTYMVNFDFINILDKC